MAGRFLATDPLGRKLYMASRKETSRLRSWVVKVVTELGHPEAFITDESVICNFRDVPRYLFDMRVYPKTKIISVAKRLKQKAQKRGLRR
jgi:hypothetical protein